MDGQKDQYTKRKRDIEEVRQRDTESKRKRDGGTIEIEEEKVDEKMTQRKRKETTRH